MADKKHSGFEAPVKGVTSPKGTKIVKNKDGTVRLVTPKDKKPNK